jgi:hypothetical protein
VSKNSFCSMLAIILKPLSDRISLDFKIVNITWLNIESFDMQIWNVINSVLRVGFILRSNAALRGTVRRTAASSAKRFTKSYLRISTQSIRVGIEFVDYDLVWRSEV